MSKNIALVNLDFKENKLTKLDVSKNIKLDYLYCNDNKLTTLDISKNTTLKYLCCQNNYISNTSNLEKWMEFSTHRGQVLPQNSGTQNVAPPVDPKTPSTTTQLSAKDSSKISNESSLTDSSSDADSSVIDSQSSQNDDSSKVIKKAKDSKGISLPVIIIIIVLVAGVGSFIFVIFYRKKKLQ